MIVSFYRNMSDKKTLNKSISKIKDVECNIKEPCSLLRPFVTMLKSELPGWNRANYAYIAEFDRYYYMGQPTITTAGRLEVQLEVDPLMSNKAGILGITCIIERSESVYNKMIKDELAPIRANRAIRYINVGQLPASSCYCITCDGGAEEIGQGGVV